MIHTAMSIPSTSIKLSNQRISPELHLLDLLIVPSVSSSVPYAFVNIVFKAFNSFKDICISHSLDYSDVYVAHSHDLVSEYLESLDFSISDDLTCDSSSLLPFYSLPDNYYKTFHKAYHYHFSPLLKYLPKFDTFYYREYISWTYSTIGSCFDLFDISQGTNNFRTTESYVFLNLLKSFNLFWD